MQDCRGRLSTSIVQPLKYHAIDWRGWGVYFFWRQFSTAEENYCGTLCRKGEGRIKINWFSCNRVVSFSITNVSRVAPHAPQLASWLLGLAVQDLPLLLDWADIRRTWAKTHTKNARLRKDAMPLLVYWRPQQLEEFSVFRPLWYLTAMWWRLALLYIYSKETSQNFDIFQLWDLSRLFSILLFSLFKPTEPERRTQTLELLSGYKHWQEWALPSTSLGLSTRDLGQGVLLHQVPPSTKQR